jgi:PilZ domain
MLFDKMNGKFPVGSDAEGVTLQTKRSEVRRLVILNARLQLVTRFGHAHVVNLSRSGLRGVTDMALSVGQSVIASLDDITHCSGLVRWVDQRRFGMQFDTILDGIPDYAHQDPGVTTGQKERPPRITTNLIAKIRLCGAPVPAKIRNVSKSGMMVETELQLSSGHQLFIKLSNNKVVPAEVVWNHGSRTGVRLNTPISILQFTYGDLR